MKLMILYYYAQFYVYPNIQYVRSVIIKTKIFVTSHADIFTERVYEGRFLKRFFFFYKHF